MENMANQYSIYMDFIKLALYKNGTYGGIADKINQLTTGNHHSQFIDMLCTQLESALKSRKSSIANRASYIFVHLAQQGRQQIIKRMAVKKFQDSLSFALRGKTSLLGNRLSLHPYAWEQIQNRILFVYKLWADTLPHQDERYKLIIQRYNQLVKLKLKFPEPKPLANFSNARQSVQINQQDQNLMKELLIHYQKCESAAERAQALIGVKLETLKQYSIYLFDTYNTNELSNHQKQEIRDNYMVLQKIIADIEKSEENPHYETNEVTSNKLCADKRTFQITDV